MKKFTEMNDVEREAFLIFVQYASGDHMSIQGVRNLAKDYCLDFELLKALLDGDGNSVIDFSEFVSFWSHHSRFASFNGEKLTSLRSWLSYFNSIDTDGDGVLTIPELRTFCESQGHRIDFDQLLPSLDKDGSGTISFQEFLLWYNIHS